MPELLNRTFFNFTVSFVAILLLTFTMAVVVGMMQGDTHEDVEQKVPLKAHGT